MTKAFDRDEILGLSNREIREKYMAIFKEAPKSPNKVWMVNQMEESFQRARVREEEAREAARRRSAQSEITASDAAPAAPTRELVSDVAASQPSPVIVGATPHTAGPPPAADVDVATLEAVPQQAGEEPSAAAELPSAIPPEAPVPAAEAAPGQELADEVPNDAPLETQPAPLVATAPELPAPAESGAQLVAADDNDDVADAATTTDGAAVDAPRERGRYRGMTVEELQLAYARIVGRPTSSSDRPYMVWKITQAEKGRVPVGPIAPGKRREGPFADAEKTLPLTIAAAAVVAVDEAWARQGFRSRMAFLRSAIREALLSRGEAEAAAHFPEATPV